MQNSEVKAAIRAKFTKQFEAYGQLGALVDQLVERNQGKIVIAEDHPSTQAVASLYAKARKTTSAVGILAEEGYGEDATILARSLVNLCIDLCYIYSGDQDELAAQWMASGWWERVRMARKLGNRTLETLEHDYNTPEGEEVARRWSAIKIRERAERAGQGHLYQVAYKHGSAYEHSDSWSMQSFADVHEGHVLLHLGPSTAEIDNALYISMLALYQIAATLGHFFGFDLENFDREAQAINDRFAPNRRCDAETVDEHPR